MRFLLVTCILFQNETLSLAYARGGRPRIWEINQRTSHEIHDSVLNYARKVAL